MSKKRNLEPEEAFMKWAKSIDFRLFYTQKQSVLKQSSNPLLSNKDRESMEGLLSFMDSIQDLLIDELGLEKSEVFPYLGMEDEQDEQNN